MIEIVLESSNEPCLVGISVRGHAEFANEEGGDIVCSAVSGLVGYLGITFTEFLPGLGEVNADDGFFELTLKPGTANDPRCETLLQAWVSAALQLEENYSGWVKVVGKS